MRSFYRQICRFLRKYAGRETFLSDGFLFEPLHNDLPHTFVTNTISIVDGQLTWLLGLFGSDQCPAVSLDKSVFLRVCAKSLDSPPAALHSSFTLLLGNFKRGRKLHEVRMGTCSDISQVSKFLAMSLFDALPRIISFRNNSYSDHIRCGA